MKSYYLFLDDFRMPSDCFQYMFDGRYCEENWVVVKSHKEFVLVVEHKWRFGLFPSLISFDHDLASEHYCGEMFDGLDAYNDVVLSFKIPTGMESAEWFKQFCSKNSIDIPECLIHSMNPAGAKRIQNVLAINNFSRKL
jgi:hypothetical protein